MSFWDGMKLWEKMLLLLAAAMSATLLFGVGRLLYNNSRIRRARKLEEARRIRLEASQNECEEVDLKRNEIPFGIRALEAGIVVQGVFMSHPPTPHLSQTTLIGASWEEESMRSQTGQFESPATSNGTTTPTKPQQICIYQPSPYQLLPPSPHRPRHGSSSSGSSMGTAQVSLSRPESPPIEGAIVPNSIPSDGSSSYRDGNPMARAGQGELSPPFSPVEQKDQIMDDFSWLPELQNDETQNDVVRSLDDSLQSSPATETPPDEFFADPVSSCSPDEQYPSTVSPVRPKLFFKSHTLPPPGKVFTAVRTEHGDLSLLHSHRLSHAAEVGQLTPRRNRTVPGHAFGSFVQPCLPVNANASVLTLPPPILTPPMPRGGASHFSVHRRWASDECMPPSGTPCPSKFTEDLPRVSALQTKTLEDLAPVSTDSASASSPSLPFGNHVVLETPPKKGKRKLQKKKASMSIRPLEVDSGPQ